MNNYENLNMHTTNLADSNYAVLAALFPNAVTEIITGSDENGVPIIERAIDAEVLAQEINTHVVSGKEERYQFTWPEKKKSVLLANAPIAATLRPCREESVNFDNTENLYIEGDNLDVLKLLRETYLNRVKMIYIDPPYNISATSIYKDDYSENVSDFLSRDNQYDEQGNRMTQNLNSNGRFHTDWLNMLYPRLRVARDLLTEDGVIFISIDDSGNENLLKICNEIFGEVNFVGNIAWESKTKSQNTKTAYNKLQPKVEHILVYTKGNGKRFNLIQKGTKDYPFTDEQGKYREYPLEVMNATGIRGRETMIYSVLGIVPPKGKQWQLGQAQITIYENGGNLFLRDGKIIIKMRPEFERQETTEPFWAFLPKEIGTAESAKKEITSLFGVDNVFDTVKPVELLRRLIYHATDADSIILDFFSGSATTAHAVIHQNALDGGHRKFILVQIPEPCSPDSMAYKENYINICEIGKERIRRASVIIKADSPLTTQDLDTGFRVLKLDNSNMKEVYYTPEKYAQMSFSLEGLMDNIKPDRSDEDLLFQVMLDLGIPLSAKILHDENVYYVNDNYLIACFARVDTNIISEIAKKHPYYAVFRDSSFINDSALVNVDQVFKTYSPNTLRRVL